MSWWIYAPDADGDGMSVTYNLAPMFTDALGLPERLRWNADGSPVMCRGPKHDADGNSVPDGAGGYVWETWQSTDHGIRLLDEAPASEAAGVLRRAVERMHADPDRYRAMNPRNGWGTYERAVEVLETLLAGCAANPDGKIMVH